MVQILLVEDEAVNRLYLRHILSKHSFTIIEARDGFEAVDAALKENPDCILMDIGLPRMDGMEAIRQIRSSQKENRVPILAVTAHAQQADKEEIMKSGADDIIHKPYKEKEILKKLQALLG